MEGLEPTVERYQAAAAGAIVALEVAVMQPVKVVIDRHAGVVAGVHHDLIETGIAFRRS